MYLYDLTPITGRTSKVDRRIMTSGFDIDVASVKIGLLALLPALVVMTIVLILPFPPMVGLLAGAGAWFGFFLLLQQRDDLAETHLQRIIAKHRDSDGVVCIPGGIPAALGSHRGILAHSSAPARGQQ